MKEIHKICGKTRSNIYLFDSISSTNEWCKKNYKTIPNRSIIIANYQSKGKGQHGRQWLSKYKRDILLSILFKDIAIIDGEKLNKIVLQVLLNVLNKYKIKGWIKKPNDIYIRDKKICGILIEGAISKKKYKYIIIGIGMNVNSTSEDFEKSGLWGKATSIKEEIGKTIDRNSLIATLIKETDNIYQKIRSLT